MENKLIDANKLKDKLWEIYRFYEGFSCELRETPKQKAIRQAIMAVDNAPAVLPTNQERRN